MKKLYITFGGAAYDQTCGRIVQNATNLGADELRVYDDRWLMTTEFYRLNEWLWKTPDMRGFGWFCWKPYVIMHALDNYCRPGDIVLYTDADTYPIADFSMLYDECARIGGIMLFSEVGCSNAQWVKRDCWIVMGQEPGFVVPFKRQNDPKLHTQHAAARFMLFRKGSWQTQQFLMEWLTYCINPLATTFTRSVLAAENDGFEQHRTEQAILSLLAHKYGLKLYRTACQFGDASPEDRELYPTLFCQSGERLMAGLEGSRYANVG